MFVKEEGKETDLFWDEATAGMKSSTRRRRVLRVRPLFWETSI
jgi:hypothetical protein